MGFRFVNEKEFKGVGFFYIINKLFWYNIFVFVLLEMVGVLVRVFMKKMNVDFKMMSGKRFLVVR